MFSCVASAVHWMRQPMPGPLCRFAHRPQLSCTASHHGLPDGTCRSQDVDGARQWGAAEASGPLGDQRRVQIQATGIAAVLETVVDLSDVSHG